MWRDKETEIDYLNFGYMVDMVVDIATNRQLSPSTIGLYGDWGSGKSSLMKLAKKTIEKRDKDNAKGREEQELKSLCNLIRRTPFSDIWVSNILSKVGIDVLFAPKGSPSIVGLRDILPLSDGKERGA